MGHVGTAMHKLFEDHADMVAYDIRQDSRYPHDEVSGCDFAVVCVDTPISPEGGCDISNVVESIKALPVDRVLLKSTIPPGTTDALSTDIGKSICYSPEYVGETSYYNPFWQNGIKGIPFVIFGGEPPVRRFFIDALAPILGPSKIYFQCTAIEAEIIKYMENAFLATKVTFATEFYHICQAFEADWHTVREGWLLDPRINSSHTAVFPQDLGFGGKCLPKDLRAIVHAAIEAGYGPNLLKEVLNSNSRFRGRSGS